MNGYVAFYDGKRIEVRAATLYEASVVARQVFQELAGRRKIKSHMVSVVLAEKDGEQVVHAAGDAL